MPDRPLVRRRTAVSGLAAGLLGGGITGCDSGEDIAPLEPPPDPGDSGPASVTPSPTADQSPDEALVDQVLGELSAALLVLADARRTPQLRQPATAMLRAHRRHLLVLEGEPPEAPAPTPSPDPADPAAQLTAVRTSEQRLQAALVDAAGRAESGALARLLASVSASVAQHLTLLPADARGRAA